ncbi:SANT/Myb-like DNA-binding domain-containing protein [Edaphosphingomonas haloaromaticamans]|uniref:Myb-like domain-containing protein n=1 Tax=Edaphosphingomonas haloaromaticamans TaxID=653954 RepID=A0A1S1HHC8_9SPHN|nr:MULTISPECIES: SANT/Myb-like DNA-binding domain-containing protein [Sphingomonas]MDX3884054.1 SANT/Myb-like DNA-binding domain-containing protein [Sphingomonas sp.]OHT19930.1 hypothetical protein BHE75_01923 [Sphingomonas haloaromaticamans]
MNAPYTASPWSAGDDEILIAAVAQLMPYGQIAELLPDRTVKAIKARVGVLRQAGSVAPSPVTASPEQRERATLSLTARAAIHGSRKLLVAMLRMGAARPGRRGLPGLTDEQFRRLCAEHGVEARP